MKLSQNKIFTCVLFTAATLVASILGGAPARAGNELRVELLGRVSVSGKQVLLSDLLPRTVPEALRSKAADVSLGRAPQLGRERSIERVEIDLALAGYPEAFHSLSIPDRVTVSSASRPITADEACEAIREQLRKSDAHLAESLRPGDVQLGAQVFVRPGDAGVRVTRTDLDPILGRVRFLLWAANDPEVLPFFATVRLDGVSWERLLDLRSANLLPTHGNAPASARSSEAVAERREFSENAARAAIRRTLVQPGQPSVLTLQNARMQITVGVVALGRGSLGQRIRVRLTGSGKIVTAEVVGQARLEAQL